METSAGPYAREPLPFYNAPIKQLSELKLSKRTNDNGHDVFTKSVQDVGKPISILISAFFDLSFNNLFMTHVWTK